MRWLSQRMWRKRLSSKHLRSLSAPSTLLVSPPIPHSSAAACRHACSFPGQLCRRHLAGTCLWGPPYSTPVGRGAAEAADTSGAHPIPALPGWCSPGEEVGVPVHTSAADSLSLLVNEEQDEGQAEDAHDAGARGQRGGRDICNRRGQR